MRTLIFVTLVILMMGCKAKPGPESKNCEVTGTVKDFTGLDGCGLLIELKNGDLLNPAKLPEGTELKENQAIRFTYKKLDDMMSICMREKAIVEITCLEIINGGQIVPPGCVDTTNPFAVPWMDKAIDKHNPNQIIKYKFGGQWGYLFKAIPTSYLYDCEGKLLCQTSGDPHDDCHETYLNRFNKGKVIWQGEGVWD
jgi:hypothetical protein